MKRVAVLGFITTLIFTLVGCSNAAITSSSSSEASSVAPSSSAAAESSKVEMSSKPVELRLPDVENTTGKLLIQTVNTSMQYGYNTYAITSSGGETIIVDPTEMPKKEVLDLSPVAIVSTHDHGDHTDPAYTDAYDCEKLIHQKGEITTKDFHIYTVTSAHSGDEIDENGTHYCMVIEVDGLRLVHMGDTGQTKLTKNQLKKLGKIDIAFMQFENSYSDMSLKNEKGFNLANQLNPTILIPTHYTVVALPVFKEKYGEITKVENKLAISKDELPEKAINMYIITNNHKYS